MNNKQLSILSLSRRAGKLVLGFDKAKEAILKGQVPCVFVTQDLSPKTQKEVEFLCGSRGVPVVPLAVEMDQVKAQVGKRSGVLLILDTGLSQNLQKLAGADCLDKGGTMPDDDR